MTTYIVTGSDTGIPRLPNDSVIAGLRKGDTFSTTLDSGVEAELIAAGLIAKSPLTSPVSMLSDGSLQAEDGRSFSEGSGTQFAQGFAATDSNLDFNICVTIPIVSGINAVGAYPSWTISAAGVVTPSAQSPALLNIASLELAVWNAALTERLVAFTPSPITIAGDNAIHDIPFADLSTYGAIGADLSLVDQGGFGAIQSAAGGVYSAQLSIQLA